ncbi:MAG TPA: hypothetical protein VEC95_03075 [Terriglobales bacterium]|nr:hypothetical protein [Terriglobales bacterium]
MKDINEVLRKKESDLQQLQKDVEALRVAIRILSEDADAGSGYPRPGAISYASPARSAPAAAGVSDAGYSAPWDASGKKFP